MNRHRFLTVSCPHTRRPASDRPLQGSGKGGEFGHSDGSPVSPARNGNQIVSTHCVRLKTFGQPAASNACPSDGESARAKRLAKSGTKGSGGTTRSAKQTILTSCSC